MKLSNYLIVKLSNNNNSLKFVLSRLFLVIALAPFWFYIRRVYRDRLGAFGCFDDCFNIVAGYFLNHGKNLYSQIFFNHQPLMAYLSAWIQTRTHPSTLYLLIYEHRIFVFWLSFTLGSILVLRFGLAAILFILLYETTKGYVFGERFLAEAVIVYPVVYMLMAVLDKKYPRLVQIGDVVIGAIFSWFIIFNREPYIPLALVLYGTILWKNKIQIARAVSIIIFILLTMITIGYHDIHEYFFNVFTVNRLTVASAELRQNQLTGPGFVRVFGWPVYQLLGGTWNLFHNVTATLSLLFLAALFSKRKQVGFLFLSILLLGLANVRPLAPGQIYYAAFHGVVWYGGLIAFTSIMLVRSPKALWGKVGIGIVIFLIVYVIYSPKSYLHERVDRQTEFTTNYAIYQSTGDTVKLLSGPGDTLFLDRRDDLIYWSADRFSEYPYSWYTSAMYAFPKYATARMDMLQNDPPTFYYGRCGQTGVPEAEDLPAGFLDGYSRLEANSALTCLFVRQTKLPDIKPEQWESVKKYGINQATAH